MKYFKFSIFVEENSELASLARSLAVVWKGQNVSSSLIQIVNLNFIEMFSSFSQQQDNVETITSDEQERQHQPGITNVLAYAKDTTEHTTTEHNNPTTQQQKNKRI